MSTLCLSIGAIHLCKRLVLPTVNGLKWANTITHLGCTGLDSCSVKCSSNHWACASKKASVLAYPPILPTPSTYVESVLEFKHMKWVNPKSNEYTELANWFSAVI